MLIATNAYSFGSKSDIPDDTSYTAISKDLQEIEQEARICFSDEAAKKLVVEIEQCRIVNKNIVNYYKSNVELTKQIELLKVEITLLKEKFEVADKLLKTNEELYKQKAEVLNNELEEAKKPRWTSMFISGGVGAALALLLAVAI
jgi:hypothetical protein